MELHVQPLYSVSLADSLREGYSHLRALVMAYGDISPQSPLSVMSSSQQTTHQTSTTLSSSERTTPQINEEEDPSLIDVFPDVASQPGQAHSAPRSWSRPQSQQSRSTPTSRPISGIDRPRNRTPVSHSLDIGDMHTCTLVHICTLSYGLEMILILCLS